MRLCKVMPFLALAVLLHPLSLMAEVKRTAGCSAILTAPIPSKFEEIDTTRKYIHCWADAELANAIPAKQSYIGEGLDQLVDPAHIAASVFWNNFCSSPLPHRENRDYPCWVKSSTPALSLLKSNKQPYLLQAHKEEKRIVLERCNAGDRGVYPEKGCMIGDIISIEELGRGDIDHDGMENMAVLIEFHAIGSTYSTCYGAIMSGLSENGLFAVKRFSKSGRCG